MSSVFATAWAAKVKVVLAITSKATISVARKAAAATAATITASATTK